MAFFSPAISTRQLQERPTSGPVRLSSVTNRLMLHPKRFFLHPSLLIGARAASRGRPALDLPPGWSCLWGGSEYRYPRHADSLSIPVHPVIAGTWTTAYTDWPSSEEPTAHWMPEASSLLAAAWWLDARPEDYVYAAAAAVVAEEQNHQICQGQCPVWLRPHPNPSREAIAIILRTIATQTAAQHPAHEWHTLHRWAREAHEYRQRPDVCSSHRTRVQQFSNGGNRQRPENLGARQLAYLRQQHRLANPPSKQAPRPKAPAAAQAQSPAAGLPLPQGPAAVTPLSNAEIYDRTRAST